jgi:predicted methyltransferase
MYRNILLWLCLLLALLSTAMAETKEPAAKKQTAMKSAVEEPAAKDKELSGMSIVGNDEAPKALYIVPWKSSEIGRETSLNMMLNDSAVPVDRDVFMRQLDFFEISTKK